MIRYVRSGLYYPGMLKTLSERAMTADYCFLFDCLLVCLVLRLAVHTKHVAMPGRPSSER